MRILLVDDDPVNRYILREYLEEDGYSLLEAEDGEEAWSILEEEGDTFSAVLLDRMMPKLDGLSVLKRMMAHDTLKHIPVIVQTAKVASNEVQEGVEAGAFFYLSQPFEQSMLLAIVAAAVRKGLKVRELFNDIVRQTRSVKSMQHGIFRVRTIDDVYDISILLAHACPDPEKIVTGLNDLLINAVEHGNLGITYDEKTILQETQQWEQEIQRRLKLSENVQKYVEIHFERLDEAIHMVITDQGQGFDWKPYEQFSPEMALASHGRGIAMAKALCFDHIEYLGNGNQVRCVVNAQAGEMVKHDKVPDSEHVCR